MNKQNLFALLLAASPLASYFLGRLNRGAGLAAAALIAGGAAFALTASGAGGAPFIALSVWALAAAAHSFLLNSAELGAGSEERKLHAARERALRHEAELKALKTDFSAVAEDEKKALVLYTAVKLLSEAVELEAAGKQFARYIKDYFGSGEFAFYVADPNAAGPALFAAGEKAETLSWDRACRAADKPFAELAWPFSLDGERAIAAPVRHAGETVGLLAVRWPEGPFARERAMGAAQKFADEVSFAVKRMQLFRQVEWLSQVDGLTGVYRRNALDEKIGEELRRAAAFRTTLGFMIADIDHFKRLNDRFGHQFGDAVLKRVGALLRAGVYETDFVGRYGGEEFGIVLPRAEPAGVLRKAESIRSRIEEEGFAQGLETVRITVSIGIAHFPRDGGDARALLAAADEALYRAKGAGRNRVVDARDAR